MLADVVSIGTPTLCYHWSQEVGGGAQALRRPDHRRRCLLRQQPVPGPRLPGLRPAAAPWGRPGPAGRRLSSSSAGRRTRPSGQELEGHEAVPGGPGGLGTGMPPRPGSWPGRGRPPQARELLEIAEICDRCLANLPKVSGRPSSPCGSATSVSCWRTGAPATPSFRIGPVPGPLL